MASLSSNSRVFELSLLIYLHKSDLSLYYIAINCEGVCHKGFTHCSNAKPGSFQHRMYIPYAKEKKK